jgi:hypothetical protein
MSAPQTANDLLFAGGGAPALQWAHPDTQQDYPVGTSYEGEVIKTSAVRQRDLQDKSKLAVWPDGSPKYVAIVTLQTSLKDPNVEQDSGLRSLWVSGKYLTNAVKDAVRRTGAGEIEEGGSLKVTLTGYGKPQQGFRPPRLFEVAYKRPSPEKRAEIKARKEAEAQAWNQAGPLSDPSDPWAQPQNPFPPAPQGFGGPAEGPTQTALDGLTPEARALIQKMTAQQQGRPGESTSRGQRCCARPRRYYVRAAGSRESYKPPEVSTAPWERFGWPFAEILPTSGTSLVNPSSRRSTC